MYISEQPTNETYNCLPPTVVIAVVVCASARQRRTLPLHQSNDDFQSRPHDVKKGNSKKMKKQ